MGQTDSSIEIGPGSRYGLRFIWASLRQRSFAWTWLCSSSPANANELHLSADLLGAPHSTEHISWDSILIFDLFPLFFFFFGSIDRPFISPVNRNRPFPPAPYQSRNGKLDSRSLLLLLATLNIENAGKHGCILKSWRSRGDACDEKKCAKKKTR